MGVELVARPTIPQAALDAFVKAIREGATVAEACTAAHIGETTARRYRDSFPEFAQAWADAYEARTDLLEQEAEKRALNRMDPESGRLITFLLRGRRRKVYGDKLEVDATVTAVDLTRARRLQEIAATDPELPVGELIRRLEAGA